MLPVELLFVGRLIHLKRIDIAIEAVSRLRRDGIDATLTVVGDGVDRPRLERLSEELGLSDVVNFVGWTDDPNQLREHYRRAFALLLPSEIEAFGMVVLEAMAAGTPVVRTAPIGGVDLLEPEVDVLIAGMNSAEAFANAVKRLHVDRNFYLQVARAASEEGGDVDARSVAELVLRTNGKANQEQTYLSDHGEGTPNSGTTQWPPSVRFARRLRGAHKSMAGKTTGAVTVTL